MTPSFTCTRSCCQYGISHPELALTYPIKLITLVQSGLVNDGPQLRCDPSGRVDGLHVQSLVNRPGLKTSHSVGGGTDAIETKAGQSPFDAAISSGRLHNAVVVFREGRHRLDALSSARRTCQVVALGVSVAVVLCCQLLCHNSGDVQSSVGKVDDGVVVSRATPCPVSGRRVVT